MSESVSVFEAALGLVAGILKEPTLVEVDFDSGGKGWSKLLGSHWTAHDVLLTAD